MNDCLGKIHTENHSLKKLMEVLSEKVNHVVTTSRTKDTEFITLKNKYEKALILLETTTRHL